MRYESLMSIADDLSYSATSDAGKEKLWQLPGAMKMMLAQKRCLMEIAHSIRFMMLRSCLHHVTVQKVMSANFTGTHQEQ